MSKVIDNIEDIASIDSKANIASPTFTGTPLSTTPTNGDNSTKIATTAFVMQNGVPSGAIILWSGAVGSIPAGWYLCNGANGTPNLQDRFIVGAGSGYAVGATGGSKDAIVVSHNHTGSTNTTGSHTHTYANGMTGTYAEPYNGGGGTDFNMNNTKTTNAGGDHSHTLTIDSNGSSGTNANLPPYYALAYIMKS